MHLARLPSSPQSYFCVFKLKPSIPGWREWMEAEYFKEKLGNSKKVSEIPFLVSSSVVEISSSGPDILIDIK